jgi:hypothetical protein
VSERKRGTSPAKTPPVGPDGGAPSAAASATGAPATSAGPSASDVSSAPATRPVRRRRAGLNALLLLLVFAVVGTAPLTVAASVFNLWTPPTLPDIARRVPVLSSLIPTPTPPDLALPRPAWVAVPLSVHASPGPGNVVARLQPGFPVLLTAHQLVDGSVWDHISWGGPTTGTGGQGWVRDSMLTSVRGRGPAVGDAGALSPALAAALTPLEPDIALAVYYPAAQQLYLADAYRAYPLGNGARTLLLAALLAQATGSDQVSEDTERQLAAGDPATASAAYAQIGGSAGLKTFAARLGLTIPDAADWTQTQATPRALVQFYAMLAGASPAPDLGALDSSGRSHVLALVADDPEAATIAALDTSATGAHVALVVGALQQTDGWTANAAGVLTAPNGLTYVAAVCVRAQMDQAQAERALRVVFSQLATIAAG